MYVKDILLFFFKLFKILIFKCTFLRHFTYITTFDVDINQHVKIFDLKTTDPEKEAKYFNGAVAVLNLLSLTVLQTVSEGYDAQKVSVRKKYFFNTF